MAVGSVRSRLLASPLLLDGGGLQVAPGPQRRGVEDQAERIASLPVCVAAPFVVTVSACSSRFPKSVFGCAGTLRFGMDERTAQWAGVTVAVVRDGWVCGALK